MADIRQCSHLRSADRQRRGRVLGRLERQHARHEPVVRQGAVVDVTGQNVQTTGLHLWPGNSRSGEHSHGRHPQRPEGLVGRWWYRATRCPQRLEWQHHLANTTSYGTRRLDLELPRALQGEHLRGGSVIPRLSRPVRSNRTGQCRHRRPPKGHQLRFTLAGQVQGTGCVVVALSRPDSELGLHRHLQ